MKSTGRCGGDGVRMRGRVRMDCRVRVQGTFRVLSGAILVLALATTVIACSEGDGGASSNAATDPAAPSASGWSAPVSGYGLSGNGDERDAYFGDLHVHTTYSMDAFQFGTLATPDDAYRYAQGEAIKHPAGFDIQLDRPLDFYAVTDHGFYLGVMREVADTSTEISKYPASKPLHNLNAPENLTLESLPTRNFRAFIGGLRTAIAGSNPLKEEVQSIMRSTWEDEVLAAERHYEPGTFTTFAAYEFSSTKEDSGSMHRHVIFRGAENPPAVPSIV